MFGLALPPGFRPKARSPPNAPSGARDDEELRRTEFDSQGQFLAVRRLSGCRSLPSEPHPTKG
jgi:hypothetical protein